MKIIRKKILLFIFILICILGLSTYYLFKIYGNRSEVKGISEKKVELSVPYISNLVPNVAYVGEEYVFIPNIVYNGNGIINVSISEGPKWLRVDREMIIRGVPSSDDVGSIKVVINVSDGIRSSNLTDYIIVNGSR